MWLETVGLTERSGVGGGDECRGLWERENQGLVVLSPQTFYKLFPPGFCCLLISLKGQGSGKAWGGSRGLAPHAVATLRLGIRPDDEY